MSRKWLIAVIEVDDEKLTPEQMSELPLRLKRLLSRGALQLKRVYLQTAAAKKMTVRHLQETSLEYPTAKPKAEPTARIIYLEDYDRRRFRPRAGSRTPAE